MRGLRGGEMNIIAVIVDEVPKSCHCCMAQVLEREWECGFFDDGRLCPEDGRPDYCPLMTATQYAERAQ